MPWRQIFSDNLTETPSLSPDFLALPFESKQVKLRNPSKPKAGVISLLTRFETVWKLLAPQKGGDNIEAIRKKKNSCMITDWVSW